MIFNLYKIYILRYYPAIVLLIHTYHMKSRIHIDIILYICYTYILHVYYIYAADIVAPAAELLYVPRIFFFFLFFLLACQHAHHKRRVAQDGVDAGVFAPVYTHTHTHTHTHTYTHTHTQIHTHNNNINIYMRIHIHTHTYVHSSMRTHSLSLSLSHTHTHPRGSRMRTQMKWCADTYISMRHRVVQGHTNTHTHTRSPRH